MKLKVIDWSDEAYQRTREATGETSSEVIAEIEIEQFKGFSFDGGRLDITGYGKTIWVMPHQWSVEVVS